MTIARGVGSATADLPGGVLVVDDSASDRRLLIEMLADAGVDRDKIDCASTLLSAREQLSQTSYECILLDLTLPDASGLDGLSVLAAAAPTVPIVIVTGHAADDLVFAALAEGADEFVCKSDLDDQSLADVVRRAVRRRAGRQRVQRRGRDHRAAFQASPAPSVTLDGSGRILEVNTAWREFAYEGGTSDVATGVGVNYLRVCDEAVGPWSEGAAEAAAGIRAVLRGDVDRFSLDYPCPDQGQERWFNLRVVPLGGRGGGAIVTHHDVTELLIAETSARASGVDVRAALDDARPLLIVVDREGTVLRVAPTSAAMFGVEVGDHLPKLLETRVLPASVGAFTAAYAEVAATPGASGEAVIRARDVDGRWHELEVWFTNLVDDPAVGGMVLTGVDLTPSRRHQIVHHLEASLFDRFPASVLVLDEHGVVMFWNERAEKLYGVPVDFVVGRSATELRVGVPEAEVRRTIMAEVLANGSWEGDYDARRMDGSTVPVHSIVERVVEPSIDFAGFVAIAIDVTERRQLEEELAFQALHDPLTSLPNRRLFIEHLEGSLARASRNGTLAAVIYFDLDDFKRINDSAGHAAGDEVLRTMGSLLDGLVREGDIAARLGGDEFVVCCDVRDEGEALRIADRLVAALAVPFRFENRLHESRTSVGIAFSHPGIHAEGLLRNADMALYAAKEAGKGCIRVFDGMLHQQARDRHQLAGELRAGIEAGQLITFFQPEIALATGELRGFEALVRWRHPVRGIVGPIEFISLAEEEDLIGAIGEWVLRDACAAIRTWSATADAPMVSVNVSMRQLSDPAFVGLVEREIRAAGIRPDLLCLELTESALMDAATADEVLAALKAVGVRIAIDDFGTGYSSLSRLRRFPVDYLKVDKSFVDGLTSDDEDAVIVTTVINLAASLGLETIAEGIETDEQRVALLGLGCELGQGYLWSRPVPFEEANRLVTARSRVVAFEAVLDGHPSTAN